jgi:3-phenylpropionate/cinnamic acid dioxygenase small subunit
MVIRDTEGGAVVEMMPYTSETHQEVHQFLVWEAELLDARRYADWLDLLSEDIVYKMPVRATRAATLEGSVLPGMDHFDEDRYTLRKRVDRFETEHAWAEDPPSRTRHFVTNVRVYPGEGDDELVAKSYVLLFRSRGDAHSPDFVAAERTDVLRRVAGGFKLARREILVDESVIRTQNLAVFL